MADAARRIIPVVRDGSRNYHVQPSPDGSVLAFDSDRDGERGVYVANRDGSNVKRVSGPGMGGRSDLGAARRQPTRVRARGNRAAQRVESLAAVARIR